MKAVSVEKFCLTEGVYCHPDCEFLRHGYYFGCKGFLSVQSTWAGAPPEPTPLKSRYDLEENKYYTLRCMECLQNEKNTSSS